MSYRYESVDANQKAGITMLQNGDNDQALYSFRRALVETRQCIAESAPIPEQPQGAACREYFELPFVFEEQGIDTEHSGDVSTLTLSVALGESQISMSSNLFSFYNYAFVVGTLPATYTRISQQGIDHHVRLTTVLIFNMALTCHKKGLLDGPMSLESLRKAIDMYKLVCMKLSLLSSPGAHALEDLYVIQLASWNNMGHIYSHLAEKEDAIRCRALLHQALFEDAALSLVSMHGYPYASFYFFVVCTEVRRRGLKALSSPEVLA
jgi:hypothetical protein